MNKKSLGGLLVLNLALIMTLALLAVSPDPVEAQIGGRRPGDYVMVAGKALGIRESVIYITDLNNGIMLAIRYDVARKSMAPVGFRPIATDFSKGPREGGGTGR